MSCNLYNQIAQGLYQGIGVDMSLTSTLWSNPDRIGVSNANVGQFSAANISSINTYSLTAQTLNIQSISYSTLVFNGGTNAITNTQQLGVSSISTFSMHDTIANFPQFVNSSIGTYSVVGATANFQQLVNSSISTFSIIGNNANFQGVTNSSIGSPTLIVGAIANIPEIVTPTISTFSIVGDNANFTELVVSSISTFSQTGTTNLQQVSEIIDIELNATGIWPHNFNNGSIFYHSSIVSNFTTALFNVPTFGIVVPPEPIFPVSIAAPREMIITLILAQGATPYYSPTLTINGDPVPIQWIDGLAPTPIANKIECEVFNIFFANNAWYALGNYLSFGTL